MTNKDIYRAITDRIINGLEKGKIPWRKTWKGAGEMPKNFISKKPYRGVNAFVLFFNLIDKGFSSPYYLTFKQVQTLGGKVKKGSKSELIVFWQWLIRETEERDASGQPKKKKIPFLKYYRVFNIEQTEGIKYETNNIQISEFQQIDNAEKFVVDFKDKPPVNHGGSRACYRPLDDVIMMPQPETFENEPEYYGTLFHELTHSTGHKERLNREGVTESDGFGREQYSREELTAEIGTAFICALTGISNEKLEENQQAYINGWISKLKSDPKLIFVASGRAQKAVDYMQGRRTEEKAE